MFLKLKVILAKLLVNELTGKIIALLYSNKIPFHDLIIEISNFNIKRRIAASLFFKTYESAEIRFISEYLQNYEGTIVEFGASIGVVSSTLAKSNPKAQVISFEADSRFIPIIEQNFKINGILNARVCNEIIGAQGYEFIPGEDNTRGKITKSNQSDSQLASLKDLISKYDFPDTFVLVCDIEGAEYFVLSELNFQNCPLLIMELHPIEIEGALITVPDLKNKILKLGYEIIEEYGSNIVAKNNKIDFKR